MKLLFDQNLSYRLPELLKELYPDSTHVSIVGLRNAPDIDIWNYAKESDFVIVSKDSDFQQKSLLYGAPPKFIWIRVGNSSVKKIENLLRDHSISMHTFFQKKVESHLILS